MVFGDSADRRVGYGEGWDGGQRGRGYVYSYG